MKYIKFSSESDCFTAKKVHHLIHLTWFSTLDLSKVKKVGLTNIQFYPIIENTDFDYYLILYCNLIQKNELNPNGELESIRIPKKHHTIPHQLHLGNFKIICYYDDFMIQLMTHLKNSEF